MIQKNLHPCLSAARRRLAAALALLRCISLLRFMVLLRSGAVLGFTAALIGLTALLRPAAFAAPPSHWVRLEPGGRLAYETTPGGDRIMDFSAAGYGGGCTPLPLLPVKQVVQPTGGDDSAAIQQAVDAVSALPLTAGLRGVVLLGPGTFHCSQPITLRASGVVVRGATGPNPTVITMTGAPHVCFVVGGKSTVRPDGPSIRITDAYVPSGASAFHVAETAGLRPGDSVMINHPITPAWVHFMGMDQLVRNGKKEHWVSGAIQTERRVAAVNNGVLQLDVPLSDSLDARFLGPGGATVQRVNVAGRIENVGVENLQIVSPPQAIGIAQPQHQAAKLSGVQDGWLKNLAVTDTIDSVGIGHDCRRITVEQVSIRHTVATVGAAKPADFSADGTQILFNECSSTGKNLFYFVTGARATGPIVLLHCTFRGPGWIQPHQRWATGLLVDSCDVPQGGIDFMNRGEMGSGHGWTIGWAVAWNCRAKSFINQNPPGALNFCIGCHGARETAAMPFEKAPKLPEGIYDSHGAPVSPASLYLAQLRERSPQSTLEPAAAAGGAATAGTAAAVPTTTAPTAAVPTASTPPAAAGVPAPAPEILTPKPPATPRLVGPRVYGERPGRPFLYTIPATGEEPLAFEAEGLPDGLKLDARRGRIVGVAARAGDYRVRLTARNRLGVDRRTLLVRIGEQVCLTPPMGWNSWNCFGGAVTQADVAAQAEAMARSGLARHGWTYINIDDTWQGARGGAFGGLQGNRKFPDMKQLCEQVHGLGLKAGIYSTPWVTSYAGYPGGSAENPQGTWTRPVGPKQLNKKILPWAVGRFSFARQDARQWAEWGFDYLKYDWNPIEAPQVQEMADALKESGRDFVFSLSNHAPIAGAADWARHSNAWRTTGDIRETWASMAGNGFSQDAWAPFGGPGHWNDPDMLVVGRLGWGRKLHPTQLTADEQTTHISLWCLLASPLLLGCDLTQLDDFTLSLLTNDEVLAVDQDSLGKQARRVAQDVTAGTEVWARPLADGTAAVGLFNVGRYAVQAPPRARVGAAAPRVWRLLDRATGQSRSFDSQAEAEAELRKVAAPAAVTVDWTALQQAGISLTGPQPVRDLWRQKELGAASDRFTAEVPFHGVLLVRIGSPKDAG